MRISDWSSDVCSSDLTLEDHSGIASADGGGNSVLNGLGSDAEPRHDVTARPDIQHRQAFSLLHPNIDSAFGLAQDCSDLVRRVVHSIEIVTEDFDRDVTAHPGDQFVEAHLDRLGYLKRAARTALDRMSTRLNSSH